MHKGNGYAWLTALLALIAWPSYSQADEKETINWPSFRGTQARGVSDGASSPTTWDVEKNEGVRWKTEIPGLGLSSPVIWGDRVFVTTAVRTTGKQKLKVGLYGDIQSANDQSPHKWQVLCIDKKNGKVLWEQTACEGVPQIKRHTKASHANSTPATDGRHVVAFFGSEGLYCYDMDGKLQWKRDLGLLDSGYYAVPDAQWGFGSSPVIYQDRVVIQCDVEKGSFVAALNLSDGSDLWMTQRAEVPTWGTPTVYNGQVICNGYKHIGGYDLATGKEVWRLRGGGDIPVPTPVVAHDLIFITNGHGSANPVYAIRPTAKGKIKLGQDEQSNEHIAYRLNWRGTYMQTPLVYGEYLYCCRDDGVVSCFEAKTGKEQYKKRIGKGVTGFTASPVAADGKLYFTSEEGDVYVIKAGPVFEELAKNPLSEVCMATPAISEGVLFFRGQKHLIAVGETGR